MNRTPLLNRKAVKELALEICKTSHAGQFTRVGKEFLDRVNAHIEVYIRSEIHRHPSIGKTLK